MKLENKTILVTGGAGAIGSNLVKQLLEKDCKKIIVLDDMSSGFTDDFSSDKVVLINGDITDDDVLDTAFSEKIDIIFHLAAHFANQNSVEHPVEDLETNGKGTLKLLMRAVDNEVKRFVYASSSCVYGNKAGELEEDDAEFDLGTPYAITKLLGEFYVQFFNKHYGINTVIIRYFNSYGPGEMPGKYRNVIPNFIESALENKALPITGKGDETRDFTFVEDAVKGTILACENEKAVGDVFNIGRGQEVSIIDLAKIINRLTGNKAGVEFKEKRSWDHIIHRKASIKKAKDILGYEPKISIEEGIERTIRWIKGLG